MSNKIYNHFRKYEPGSMTPNIKILWKGKGLNEVGYDRKTGKILVKVDPVYFRPTDVDELRGDASKAKRELKWKSKTSFKDLVKEMMIFDLKEIK